MSKRFVDTQLWDKEWYMDLPLKTKCLIRYLFDKCDNTGLWNPNWRLASVHIGEQVCLDDLKKVPEGQYEIIGGKIFLPGFIPFQYGQLSVTCPAHKPVFRQIDKNNLSNRLFGSLQEKEKEKEEDKEKEGKGVQGKNYYTIEDFKNYISEAQVYRENICMVHKLSETMLKSLFEKFTGQQITKQTIWPEQKAAINHFGNWLIGEMKGKKDPGAASVRKLTQKELDESKF